MWEFYEKSSPIRVKGGIKSQAKKGEFSKNWWGKRWITALESFNDKGRLSRGRSYARQGQVLNIEIQKCSVTASVQGSRETPYSITIEMEALSSTAWKQVIEALSKKALYSARLLAGELPNDIEQVFSEVNVKLLPTNHSDLQTDCSCPDWSNPCKHVAAVLYLLAERFDEDPFLIFKTRGMDREEFLKELEKCAMGMESKEDVPMRDPVEEEQIEALSNDLGNFWECTPLPENLLEGLFDPPQKPALIISGMGKFPFWRGETPINTFLKDVYGSTTKHASALLF